MRFNEPVTFRITPGSVGLWSQTLEDIRILANIISED